LTGQSRSVSIAGAVPGSAADSSFNQTVDAIPGTPFSQGLANSAGTDPASASASAVQLSTIALVGGRLSLVANGSVEGSSSDTVSSFTAASQFSLTFAVDEPVAYLFNEEVSSDQETSLSLLGADLTSAGESILGVSTAGPPRLQAADVPTFQTTGILSPGTYTLSGGASGEGSLTSVDASYIVNFSAIPVSQMIPVPPAFWSGAIGLALSALTARRMRN